MKSSPSRRRASQKQSASLCSETTERFPVKEEPFPVKEEPGISEDVKAEGLYVDHEVKAEGLYVGHEVKAEGLYVGHEVKAEGLYVGHEVKEELVFGPEVLQQQDIAVSLQNANLRPANGANVPHCNQKMVRQYGLKSCFVRLERLPMSIVHAHTHNFLAFEIPAANDRTKDTRKRPTDQILKGLLDSKRRRLLTRVHQLPASFSFQCPIPQPQLIKEEDGTSNDISSDIVHQLPPSPGFQCLIPQLEVIKHEDGTSNGPSSGIFESTNKSNGEGGRGTGRGRGAGKFAPKELFPVIDSAIAGPSTRLYSESKKAAEKTKKSLKSLSPAVQAKFVEQKRAKEMERFLLPDAPARKRSKKISTNRRPCRLSDGTPSTPPSPKLRQWEIRNQAIEIRESPPPPSGIISPSTPNHNPENNYDTPTSTISLDSCVEVAGFSPLLVDWATGNLRVQSSNDVAQPAPQTATKKKAPKTKSKPDPIVVPRASPSSSTFDRPGPTPPKRIICGSDLYTSKADDIFDSWRSEIEEVVSDAEEEATGLQAHDFASSEAAMDLEPANLEWLNREDAGADKTMKTLLPIDHLTFDWNSDPTTFTGKREEFLGTPGPTFTVTENMTALDIFLKFFDDDLLDLIVTETNNHAKRMMDRQTSSHSRIHFWKDTNRSEIVVFFAILILQGCAPLSVEVDYWRENGYLTLKYFKDLMTYNRFVLIKKFLHFSDNDSKMTELTLDEKKLRKIWPLLDRLNRKFSGLYLPDQNIAIDESLLKWHGRLSFAQKIATKALKVGIKSYELRESSTGYLWSFFVYTGKGHDHMTDDQNADNTDNDHTDRNMDDQQTGNTEEQQNDIRLTNKDGQTSLPPPPTNATAQIVHVLAKPLLNKGYTLIMDNFYNAPLLARYLKGQQTDCFGTLRINREFVPESFKKTLKSDMRPGEVVQSFCRDISVMMWRDINIVSMISTYHEGNVGGKEKYGSYKYKPEVVLDYNTTMAGVDKKDQLLSAFKIERTKNIAWYKKVFRRLLNITALNAYIVFKTKHPTISHRAFRLTLADEMINKYLPPRIDRPLQVQTDSLLPFPGGVMRPILTGNHFIGQGQTKYGRCIWCRQSRTKHICKQCKVSLCLETCFEQFHTART